MTHTLQQQNILRRRQSIGTDSFRQRPIYWQRGSIQSHTIVLSLGVISLIFLAMLGFFYLQQVLGSASQGSDIHALETQLDGLKERQHALELEGAQLRSLKTIEQRVEKLNLVRTDTVAYLLPTPHQVAVATFNE